ncbi:MAG: IS200/IS605 family transposase [Chitinophagaceae bacterium]|nr:IS200/IS605 family transposase [Chitinophagaceae bacterium]
MGQSLSKIGVHIVFSTKNRHPSILPDIENELHKYLGGVSNNLKCPVITTGGYNDHVHVLSILSSTIPLMKLIETLKSHSSLWVKSKGDLYKDFYWQRGYGAFAVSAQDLRTVADYIGDQRTHHQHVSFQEELRSFLIKYEIPYNERYLWE